MATSGGSVPFAIDESSMSSVTDAVSGMGSLAVAEIVLLSVLIAVVFVGVAGVLTYLSSAENRIERELAEVEAEQAAYRQFAAEVADLSVQTGAATATTPQSLRAVKSGGPSVDVVQSAFETTVMAVDHYDDIYGEPWLVHLAGEFNEDIAVRLQGGGTVNAPLKQALRQQAIEAADNREDLIHVLTTEREAIEDATETAESVVSSLDGIDDQLADRSFDELAAAHEDLEALQDRTDRLVRRRQRQIHRETRCGLWGAGDLTLQEYLYGPSPTTYPVLAAGLELTDDIRQTRRRVVANLSSVV
ncbi:MAG: DUF7260 family protein [archaeon]